MRSTLHSSACLLATAQDSFWHAFSDRRAAVIRSAFGGASAAQTMSSARVLWEVNRLGISTAGADTSSVAVVPPLMLSYPPVLPLNRTQEMSSIHGSCLCGGVQLEITGPLFGPLNCHCSLCRKQHGAAFRSRIRVKTDSVRWLAGQDLIKYYDNGSGYLRGFCRECGSPVVNQAGAHWKKASMFPDALNEYGIPLAILEDPPIRPACHVFVGSKAPWFEITDDLPQYPELPPPR